MNKGTMGFKAPSLGGRSFRSASASSAPRSMISGASTGMDSPPMGNLGKKVIGMLRGRRMTNRGRARKL